MFKLLKGGVCYSPKYMGKKDILVVKDVIYRIEDSIAEEGAFEIESIDLNGKIICPGFIDQHVHITGGGGEAGPASRVPELMLSEIVSAGITTVVGVLGFDSITRNISGLLAKARSLEEEGLNTYIYTGSYGVPTATLTGEISKDISIVDKVIGVGEIAISDHRSSHPSPEMLRAVAYQARTGGLTGKKAGVVHIHVGDGKKGLEPLNEITENSDFPLEMFVPTHLNRNRELFEQAVKYALKGGYVDFTAGQTNETGYSVPDALEKIYNYGVNTDNITVSSDGNGSIPSKGGEKLEVGRIDRLYTDIIDSILVKKLDIESVLKTVTSNTAKVLKIYPQKGTLSPGSDADFLVLEEGSLKIYAVMINGEFFLKDGKVLRKGIFDRQNQS